MSYRQDSGSILDTVNAKMAPSESIDDKRVHCGYAQVRPNTSYVYDNNELQEYGTNDAYRSENAIYFAPWDGNMDGTNPYYAVSYLFDEQCTSSNSNKPILDTSYTYMLKITGDLLGPHGEYDQEGHILLPDSQIDRFAGACVFYNSD